MSETMALQMDETAQFAVDRELSDALRSNVAMLFAIRWLLSCVRHSLPNLYVATRLSLSTSPVRQVGRSGR